MSCFSGDLTGVADGGRLSFADDVEANVRFADEASDKVKRYIDDYIGRAGIDAPVSEPDPAETVAMRQPNPTIGSLDLSRSGITSVVWCTGFKGDFSWVRLPDALDAPDSPFTRMAWPSCRAFTSPDWISPPHASQASYWRSPRKHLALSNTS